MKERGEGEAGAEVGERTKLRAIVEVDLETSERGSKTWNVSRGIWRPSLLLLFSQCQWGGGMPSYSMDPLLH